MDEMKPKNFRIPTHLAAEWDKKFNPGGAKTSSRHAAGALFLYWAMPDFVRRAAEAVAQESDIEMAKAAFWRHLQADDEETQRVRKFLSAVEAREGATVEKTVVTKAKSK